MPEAPPEVNTARLSWINPVDEDLDYIEISYSEGVIQTTAETIDIIDLLVGEEYTFSLTAVDKSGQRSSVESASVLMEESRFSDIFDPIVKG